MSSSIRPVLTVALMMAALATLAGCSEFEPTPLPTHAQLVGEWHWGHGATIELKSNGTAVLTDIPIGVLEDTSSAATGRRFNLTGSWMLRGFDDRRRDPEGDPVFAIDLLHVEGSPVVGLEPIVQGTGRDISFYWIIGDPDNDDNVTFTR